MARIQILPISTASDGDASLRPDSEWTIVDPPTIYLDKIGQQWAEHSGQARPGKCIRVPHVPLDTKTTDLTLLAGARFYLDQLPSGYVLYERARPGNPKHVSWILVTKCRPSAYS